MELYEEVENTKKSKLTMIIGICIAVLIVLTILIICGIIYLNGAVMRITVDGQSKNAIEQILYIPENSTDELYIPIRAIAKYLNYEAYRGTIKSKKNDENYRNCFSTFIIGSNWTSGFDILHAIYTIKGLC